MPNFAWSSQGRGFFTDRAGRDKRDNAELVRVWYSEKNFARRDRAIELAKQLGKSPIHIALAYVLAQPFPSIPLIGPRTLGELDDSLHGARHQADARAGAVAGGQARNGCRRSEAVDFRRIFSCAEQQSIQWRNQCPSGSCSPAEPARPGGTSCPICSARATRSSMST